MAASSARLRISWAVGISTKVRISESSETGISSATPASICSGVARC
nr:MAG TPA: hypothetical protein [Caudoviricetes sp.]